MPMRTMVLSIAVVAASSFAYAADNYPPPAYGAAPPPAYQPPPPPYVRAPPPPPAYGPPPARAPALRPAPPAASGLRPAPGRRLRSAALSASARHHRRPRGPGLRGVG